MKLLSLSAVAMLVATGAIVPLATVEGADGHTTLERLLMQVEDTVNQTLADLSPVPVEPIEVYGATEDHRIHRLIALVRVQGDVDLDELTVLHQADGLDWHVAKVLRDEDGSMAGDVANKGDLLRIEATLDVPLDAGDEMALILDAQGRRPSTWLLGAPRNTGPDLVAMEHSVRI